MKNFVKVLEKIGSSQSINQVDSVTQIFADVDCSIDAFNLLLRQSSDTVCLLMPDDDEEE